MSIKPLHIETVFSGFIHLLWITLLTLFFLEESPAIILNFLEKIGSGTAVLLIALAFSLSFFLGRIAEHFIIGVNYFIQKTKRQKYADSFEGTKGEIWGNKIFSFSSFCGLTVLVILLSKIVESWKILSIGVILIFITLISFLYWYNFAKRKSN